MPIFRRVQEWLSKKPQPTAVVPTRPVSAPPPVAPPRPEPLPPVIEQAIAIVKETGLREPAVPREPGIQYEPAVPAEPQLTH